MEASTSSTSAPTLVSVPTFFRQLRLDEDELSEFVNENVGLPPVPVRIGESNFAEIQMHSFEAAECSNKDRDIAEKSTS